MAPARRCKGWLGIPTPNAGPSCLYCSLCARSLLLPVLHLQGSKIPCSLLSAVATATLASSSLPLHLAGH